jgi:Ras-related GTP-binding protein C/D
MTSEFRTGYDDVGSNEEDTMPYGSFPNDLGYGDDISTEGVLAANDESRQRIILTGLRRAGKTSIQKVVFHKMSPNETFYLEPTTKIIKNDISNSSFVHFQIWDFPGDVNFNDPKVDAESIFKQCSALIFVLDAQEHDNDGLSLLISVVSKAYSINPRIKFEVFIHKVDGLSDDHKIETQRDVQQKATDELNEARLQSVHLTFHLTSIYDHSIYEAFSKVIQKLIPQLPTLENLLDILISNSRMEKAFLIDIVSKIYIATDSSPVDMQTYELCSDMIDVVIDISCIYGMKEEGEVLTDDPNTQSIIKLNNGMILYLREINKYLALVCLIREDKFDKHGLIDYNFECFKNAIMQVFDVGKKTNKGGTPTAKFGTQQQQKQNNTNVNQSSKS